MQRLVFQTCLVKLCGQLTWRRWLSVCGVATICVISLASAQTNADELPALTSLSDPEVRYTVPETPWFVLSRSGVEAVIADNREIDNELLPSHKAGYSGLVSLKHKAQPRNVFVPSYAGLNLEHLIDGSLQDRSVLFEPRHVPMQLRVISESVAELYQAATPHYSVESCQRFEILKDGTIELTVECIPRRRTWLHNYLILFWASYIDQPESLDIHFQGHRQTSALSGWIRGITPAHGVQATHRDRHDHRDLLHATPFPLTLVYGYSDDRYSEPWYYGVCRGMALSHVFRPQDQIRFTQSPSGGGQGCPAWDFQWVISDCRVNQRYQMKMSVIYSPWPRSPEDQQLRDELSAKVKDISNSIIALPERP